VKKFGIQRVEERPICKILNILAELRNARNLRIDTVPIVKWVYVMLAIRKIHKLLMKHIPVPAARKKGIRVQRMQRVSGYCVEVQSKS